MLFDHCAECKRCCVVDDGYEPLEVSLTRFEQVQYGSICIQTACMHLGNQGCRLGVNKPLACDLYPLSFNPKSRSFSIDRDCPLAEKYLRQLKEAKSEASLHLKNMKERILEIEKSEHKFLIKNYSVDVEYFDLKKLSIKSSIED